MMTEKNEKIVSMPLAMFTKPIIIIRHMPNIVFRFSNFHQIDDPFIDLYLTKQQYQTT